jgi:V/A-type H+-transporting ATPase subunit A
MVDFHKEANKALKEGVSLADIRAMPIITRMLKAKFEIPDDQLEKLDELSTDMFTQFKQLEGKQEVEQVIG